MAAPDLKKNQTEIGVAQERREHIERRSLTPAAENIEYALYKMVTAKTKAEESDGNWLVSYADMMTLLVGFFLLLQSFSKIDSTKFEQVKKETTKLFGGEYKIPFEKLTTKLKDVVKTQNLEGQVVFQESDAGIEITFRGALFFDSGSVALRSEAKTLLDRFIPTINENAKDFGVTVEGHTDNRPVVGGQYTSNWELSSLRACTVLKLFESNGFSRFKLRALGWGDTKPIVPNEDAKGIPLAENQSQNRRVVVKILRDFGD